jgi:hypothetical protein
MKALRPMTALLALAVALALPSASQAAPESTGQPAVTGTLEVGQVLTATTGSWTDPGSNITSYAYQWQRCLQYTCTDIDGATASTYTLTQSDLDEQMDVVVTATDASGAFEDAVSEQTYLVGSGEAFWAFSESLSGTGQGSLSGSASGSSSSALSCPGACGSSFASGTTITISEQPASGSTFSGWGGACSGTAVICQVSLSADEAVTATFSLTPQSQTQTQTGGQGGGAQATCPPACPAPPRASACFTTGVLERSGRVGRTRYAFSGAPGPSRRRFLFLLSRKGPLRISYSYSGHSLRSHHGKASVPASWGTGTLVVTLRHGHHRVVLRLALATTC